MISFSLKRFSFELDSPWERSFVAGAGLAVVSVALYRAPAWLESSGLLAVAAAIAAATVVFVLALGAALAARAGVVKRVAMEIIFLGSTLVAAEAVLIALSPAAWSENYRAQRAIAQKRAALAQGIDYDDRLRTDVIREIQAERREALPGAAQSMLAHPAAVDAIRERGFVPLANASNAHVVECNEGTGYLQYTTDELGFNNPAGLVSGRVDIAAIGESLTVGHCVAPATSAIDRVRQRYPRTANFGVAGSRVLSQLGVFREYVEPLEPSVVLWFLNTGFAEPQEEADRHLLVNYLDSSFSQRLRHRQQEVDSFVREVLVPVNLQQDDVIREELERAADFPLGRLFKLREIRGAAGSWPGAAQTPPAPDLEYFERALELIRDATSQWGGQLVVVLLPSYALSTGQPYDMVRYLAVRDALSPLDLNVVNGVSVFEAEKDFLSLYTLRVDSHPNERGHALLADTVITALQRTGAL